MNDIQDIKDSVGRIEHILVHRWWLFTLMFFIALLSLIALYVDISVGKRVERTTSATDSREARNEFALDAAMKQMIIYQQQTVQRWDALAKWNPKVRVPKAVVTPPRPPPPVTSPTPTETPPIVLSEADLSRNPTSSFKGSKATSVRHKPTPTKLPWWKRLGGNTR